jgi:integrase
MQTETLELTIEKHPKSPISRPRRNPRGVFEKAPGSGEWWIRYVDASGRYGREKAGTKSAAINLVRKRKMGAFEGKKLPEKLRRATVSFAEIASDALTYSKENKLSYSDDVCRMETLLRWFREYPAEGITPQNIERRFAQQDWSPATANRYRALLSLTYRLAIRNGKATANPARSVEHRVENNARTRWLSLTEEKSLRAEIATTCPEHMPELDLALNTGLRLSEMYGLTWDNVNFAQRVLTIPRSKNGHPRHVSMNGVALRALLEFRSRGDGTGPVIRNVNGEPLSGSRHWFEPALEKAGIEGFGIASGIRSPAVSSWRA